MNHNQSTNGKSVESGLQESRAITREYARTFFVVSLFLPRRERYASYAVYAMCRIADEMVDGEAGSLAQDELAKLKARIDSVYGDRELESGMLDALRRIVGEYDIPKHYFDQLLEGVSADFVKHRYRDFGELYRYCYRVAGIIGLMMLRILGCRDARAEEYAVNLGVAMQLTNILRDVGEDFERGRIYLPVDEMERFGVSENQIAAGRAEDGFKKLMQFSIRRARAYYASSNPGIRMIDCLRSRFAVRAMKEVYSGILDSIERNQYDVFTRRAHVNMGRKIKIILRVLLNGVF